MSVESVSETILIRVNAPGPVIVHIVVIAYSRIVEIRVSGKLQKSSPQGILTVLITFTPSSIVRVIVVRSGLI